MKLIEKDKRLTVFTLITDYMLSNAYFKVSIVPFGILTYYAFMLHINIKESVTVLEDYVANNIATDSVEKMVLMHVGFLFAHYLYTFAFTALITFFFMNNFVLAFGKYTRQYMMIRYAEFHSLGSGKIRSLVERRSNAITTLARIFMFHIYTGVSYVISNNMTLYKKFGLQIMLWNSFMYLVFTMFYFFASPLIEKTRNRTNLTYSIVSNRLFEMISNYDIVKTYNNDSYELKKLNNDLDSYQTASLKFDITLLFCKWGQDSLLIILNAISIYMVLFGYGFGVLANYKSISFYNKNFSDTLFKFESIGKCLPLFIEQSAIYKYSCLEDCEMEDLSDGKGTVEFERDIKFEKFGLKVAGVSLIRDSTFTIKKGEKVAIYGKNGCGKSCLMKVLLGFIDYEGDIFIDGKNLKTISLTAQRSMISYVPQNPHIIEGNVLENLKYGNANISNDEVVKLCKTYKTHNVFKHFENGYSTNVGESGKFLSGGQRQQVSFMRSIIKDSDIFLIDEPTSNLDVSAETEMIDAVFTKMSKKTVFAILHNPKFLTKFDKILCIENNKITVHESYKDCFCEI